MPTNIGTGYHFEYDLGDATHRGVTHELSALKKSLKHILGRGVPGLEKRIEEGRAIAHVDLVFSGHTDLRNAPNCYIPGCLLPDTPKEMLSEIRDILYSWDRITPQTLEHKLHELADEIHDINTPSKTGKQMLDELRELKGFRFMSQYTITHWT